LSIIFVLYGKFSEETEERRAGILSPANQTTGAEGAPAARLGEAAPECKDFADWRPDLRMTFARLPDLPVISTGQSS
jgi:hypothetical protein